MEEIPFEDRHVPKAEIDWERSWWWWHPLTRAIHPAMRVTALITAAFGLLSMQLGLWLADMLFQPQKAENINLGWSWRNFGILRQEQVEIGLSSLYRDIGIREFAFLTFCLLWLTLVFGFFGGIIARRAAVELGGRTIAPWGETLRVVGSRLLSMVWVTGMHLVAIFLLLIIPVVLGLAARSGALVPVAGVLLLLAFPLVWGVGRLALSMLVCFPLAVTAITVEKKADAFEGFSRANACFFQRPVVTAMLIVALGAVGWVGYQLVYWLYLVGWHWVRDAFLSGAGLTVGDLLSQPAPEVAERAQRVARWIERGGWLTRLIVISFGFSYFWSAAAAAYLVLRKAVYNTELDEIDSMYQAQMENLPTLPPSPGAPASA